MTIRPVRFGFFKDQDATRHCYLRLRRLKQALRDEAIVRALAQELGVSGGGRKELLAAVYANGKTLTADTNFWVLPWKLLLVIVIILIILFLVFWRGRKRLARAGRILAGRE